ncbi:unnamed protein product [Vitrella brassicaformis CCMP3155]|uniref:Uncharacterized protein n=1 Tax=Vitrella brassicaformis (strain CCMP3155) TaxID=1169540 RepID=A0A0G4GS73_VITBC|nr:unnamed protein product [Vitrella brassicaformis CCMP3155]|eukprot:CEM33465.1 unnamed protein product [Vitrella brassicaformis CCMP3155]
MAATGGTIDDDCMALRLLRAALGDDLTRRRVVLFIIPTRLQAAAAQKTRGQLATAIGRDVNDKSLEWGRWVLSGPDSPLQVGRGPASDVKLDDCDHLVVLPEPCSTSHSAGTSGSWSDGRCRRREGVDFFMAGDQSTTAKDRDALQL